jgi:hypothetical protein
MIARNIDYMAYNLYLILGWGEGRGYNNYIGLHGLLYNITMYLLTIAPRFTNFPRSRP